LIKKLLAIALEIKQNLISTGANGVLPLPLASPSANYCTAKPDGFNPFEAAQPGATSKCYMA
jgi:hypothetical protein